MDIQEQIAARRRELQAQKQAETAERLAEEAAIKAAEQKHKAAIIDAVAAELTSDRVTVVRDGDDLALAATPLNETEFEGVTEKHLQQLFNREIRMRWKPLDQWIIIGLCSSGACLIPAGGSGLLLILVGLIRRGVVMKNIGNQLRLEYPELFEALPRK